MRPDKRVAAFALLAALWWGPGGAADAPVKPFDLYASGNYAAAIMAGEKQNDGEGLAVAARAVLADANLRDTPCMECLQRAEAYAARAIAADPKRTEAYVYYALALGYQARIIGVLRARLGQYPERAKRALDTALMISPNDAWTLAALGGWNIAVVHGGGSFLARLVYGASFDEGVGLFHRGIAADPGNLVLHFQFALSLASYDLEDNLQQVSAELKEASQGAPRTVYETTIRTRAEKLLDLLRQDRKGEFRALVAKYQGYP